VVPAVALASTAGVASTALLFVVAGVSSARALVAAGFLAAAVEVVVLFTVGVVALLLVLVGDVVAFAAGAVAGAAAGAVFTVAVFGVDRVDADFVDTGFADAGSVDAGSVDAGFTTSTGVSGSGAPAARPGRSAVAILDNVDCFGASDSLLRAMNCPSRSDIRRTHVKSPTRHEGGWIGQRPGPERRSSHNPTDSTDHRVRVAQRVARLGLRIVFQSDNHKGTASIPSSRNRTLRSHWRVTSTPMNAAMGMTKEMAKAIRNESTA